MLNRLPMFIISAIVIFGISACVYFTQEQEKQPKAICPDLPKDFAEKDLIGTWSADYANGNIDTIIISEDGTYKQIFTSTIPKLSFESGSQKWWIEQRDSGYLRLHLEGMRRCDDLESICQNPRGGLNPDLDRTIDYCEDVGVTMEDQVILIVTGTQYSVPKGIVLRHARLSGSDWSYVFELQH